MIHRRASARAAADLAPSAPPEAAAGGERVGPTRTGSEGGQGQAENVAITPVRLVSYGLTLPQHEGATF